MKSILILGLFKRDLENPKDAVLISAMFNWDQTQWTNTDAGTKAQQRELLEKY